MADTTDTTDKDAPAANPRDVGPLWTQEARARLELLDDLLAYVPAVEQPLVERHLIAARRLVDDPVPSRLRARLTNWWNGDRVERTWMHLHQAEQQFIQRSDAAGFALALQATLEYSSVLDDKDPIRIRLVEVAQRWQLPTAERPHRQ